MAADPDTVEAAVVAAFVAMVDRVPKARLEQGAWTVLAGLVAVEVASPEAHSDGAPNVEVVCVAYGTRCLGVAALDPAGWLVHDEHAEVLCRRALQR